jgi:hypothetical protein
MNVVAAADGSIWSWGNSSRISLVSSPQRNESALYNLFRNNYTYTSPWLTKQDYIHLLLSYGVKRYKIVEDVGVIRIKIFYYLIDIDKIKAGIEIYKPVGVRVDLNKYTFFEWIRITGVIRYLRLHYLKYRHRHKKWTRLTKFNLMTDKI